MGGLKYDFGAHYTDEKLWKHVNLNGDDGVSLEEWHKYHMWQEEYMKATMGDPHEP